MSRAIRKRQYLTATGLLLSLALGGEGVSVMRGLTAARAAETMPPLRVAGHVARCDLTAGRPSFCGGPYTGQAVLREDGAYHLCDVTLGTARFCAGLYTGRAVVRERSENYAQCDLTLGRITFCEGPYTGTAAIPQSAE